MTPSRKEEFSTNGSLVISKTFDIRKTNLQYMVKTLKISDGPTQDYEYALKNSAVGATFHLKRHIYPYIRYFCPFENLNFRTYRLYHQCCPPALWEFLSTQCTVVRFASFLSGGFITAIIINPPESKLEKRTSVQCTETLILYLFFP